LDPQFSVKKVKTLLDEIVHQYLTDLVTDRVLKRLDEMGRLKNLKD
jgi:hypothetical protein